MKLLIMQFPPVSSFFHPLRLLYSILKRLQLMFFPQYDKPIFKPTQNNMQNYSSVQPLHMDRQQMGIQNILS